MHQLDRLSGVKAAAIRRAIDRRVNGKRLTIAADWRALLRQCPSTPSTGEPDEHVELARTEQTAALTGPAEARVSVRIAPAESGKTTLVVSPVRAPGMSKKVASSRSHPLARRACAWKMPPGRLDLRAR